MDLNEIREWVERHYSVGPVLSCKVISSHINDVCRVETKNGPYILKLYGPKWRTQTEVQYELALLDHLATKRVPVAVASIGLNGQGVQTLTQLGLERPAVLFEYADGIKPWLPFSPDLYELFGQSIASVHNASDDFVSEYSRNDLDLSYLVDSSLTFIEAVADDATFELLTTFGTQIRSAVDKLRAHGLDWGPIHGDATIDNLHVNGDGQIVLFDFDCGGPGWRAADLQGSMSNGQSPDLWNAFVQGYDGVRPLSQSDAQAAPYLYIVELIWGLQIDLKNRIIERGPEAVATYLDERATFIRHQAPRFLQPN